MPVSAEAVLLPPLPAGPQPCAVAAGGSASLTATVPSGSDPGRAGDAPSAAGAETTVDGAGPRPAPGRAAGRKSGADGQRASAAQARPAPAAAGRSAAKPAPAAGNFSQTLAQSLAAHTPAGVEGPPRAPTPPGKTAGRGGAAQAPARDKKTNPVDSALALVSHGMGAAAAPLASGVASARGAAAGQGGSAAPGAVTSVSVTAGGRPAAHAVQTALAHAATAPASTVASAGASAHNPAPNASTVALGAAQLGVNANLATHGRPAAPPAALSTAVGTGAWTEELGARLTWMSHQGIQSASLQLSPEHLGPLQVSISVHHGQASVWFGAAHTETRQALERSMPQLRQMFASQGLTLGDSGVSRDSPGNGAPRQNAPRPPDPGAGAGAHAEGLGASLSPGVGLVDTYA